MVLTGRWGRGGGGGGGAYKRAVLELRIVTLHL